MSVPHTAELGVWTPEDEFVFLYACGDNRPMDECEAFTRVPEVKIGTGVVRVPVHGGAEPRHVKIFRSKGWYTFLLAHNLETENTEESVSRCKVYFSGERNR